MGRIKQRGTSENAKNFITRSQAVRKLQIPLQDFRRLCIFKGIYPREPRSKKRASKSATPSTTFYYTRDIQYLLHEPLLNKFRDQKALAKKISKALGRNEVGEAARYERNLTPRMRLDHIIKERYPTFLDALRDLDDALSMLFLFANLPSSEDVPPRTIAKCQRLTMEFEHYLIRTHSVRKSFLSIKGIYYQATVQGQDILWNVPYRFVQRGSGDIDYRIMATFVEFYCTLLGFVNFRLYTGAGLVYPPRFDAKTEESGAELSAFRLEGRDEESATLQDVTDAATQAVAQVEADRLLSLPQEDEVAEQYASDLPDADVTEPPQAGTALDQFASIDPTADDLLQPSATADGVSAADLFAACTIFLSRETPKHPLEFLLKSFGCKRVGWSAYLEEAGAYCSEDDRRITHQVVDRPEMPLPSPQAPEDGDAVADEDGNALTAKQNERVPGRVYVQPQWVWDSINAGRLLRPDLYAPGATLPPHLSPWVKPKKGEYDPALPLAEQETAAEAEAAEDSDEINVDVEAEAVVARPIDEPNHSDAELYDDEHELDGGMNVQLAASDDESSDEAAVKAPVVDEWGGFSGDEDDEHTDDTTGEVKSHQTELEAEALGRPVQALDDKAKKKTAREAAQAKRDREGKAAAEDIERRKLMMPRRKRKVFEKMQYSNARKDEEAEKLRAKRRKIERAAATKPA